MERNFGQPVAPWVCVAGVRMDKICHFRRPFLVHFLGEQKMNKKTFKTKKVTCSLGEQKMINRSLVQRPLIFQKNKIFIKFIVNYADLIKNQLIDS
jgi:hypothetical protein